MNASPPGQPTREELRQVYIDAWRKRASGQIMSPLEGLLSDVIALHPEYHGLLVATSADPASDAAAARGENPFLHLGLHVAVREQIAIDRPPGVCALREGLEAQTGGSHAAEHLMMDALAETLWEGQRDGRLPDEARYVERLRQRLRTR
jgi:hypothetical protein